MDITMVIRTLRERIKDLASKQRPLKRARKTKILSAERDALLKLCGMAPDTSLGHAAWEVQRRKAVITACINLYHELRGSEYRHNPGCPKWLWDKCDKELRAEFLTDVKA